MSKSTVIACIVVITSISFSYAIKGPRGNVLDKAGKPIKDAVVSLEKVPDKTVTTGADGKYDFGEIVLSSVKHSKKSSVSTLPVFSNSMVSFQVLTQKTPVTLALFNLSGRQITTMVNDVLLPESYSFSFARLGLPAGTYITSLKIGAELYTRQLFITSANKVSFGESVANNGSWNAASSFGNIKEDIDYINCKAVGFADLPYGVTKYDTTIDFSMKDTVPPSFKVLLPETLFIKIGDEVTRKLQWKPSYMKSNMEIKDNYDDTSVISIIPPTTTTIDWTIPSFNPVRYAVTDADDNTGYFQRLLVFYDSTVVDTVPPVITVIPDTIKLLRGENYKDTGIVAKDAIDSLIDFTGMIKRGNTLNVPAIADKEFPTTAVEKGIYTATYEVIDTHKNRAKKTRTIIVQ